MTINTINVLNSTLISLFPLIICCPTVLLIAVSPYTKFTVHLFVKQRLTHGMDALTLYLPD